MERTDLDLAAALKALLWGLDWCETEDVASDEMLGHVTRRVHSFAIGEPIDPDELRYWRLGIEQFDGDSSAADDVLAAMKLALSALYLATVNPFSMLPECQEKPHSDVGTLIEATAERVEAAVARGDEESRTVRVNMGRCERLEAQAHEASQQQRVRQWFQNVIRPQEGEGE